MTSDISQLFIDVSSNSFLFLVNSHGFDGPYIKYDAKSGFVTVYFQKKYLAVECIFDTREEDVDCKIAKLVNGKATEDYSVDHSGNLVRQSLVKLLRDRGVRDRLFTKISGLSVEDRIRVTVEDFVCMLKTHGTDVLNDDASFLWD